MNANAIRDAAVIGGGINGCTTALHLARAGMRVVVFERRGPCMEASGANAGTLSIQVKRAALVPYALRGLELWRTAPAWLDAEVGFHQRGGLALAFTPAEAEMLEARMSERRAAGAPIAIVSAADARRREPALGDGVVLASFCPLDSYVDSTIVGRMFRRALVAAGIELRVGTPVQAVVRDGAGFVVRAGADEVRARRLVLAGGVWMGQMTRWLGIEAPVGCRVLQVMVSERMPPLFGSIVGVASGRLSLKQSENGTVLIGGGWNGLGDPVQGGLAFKPKNVIGNLRLACHALPALKAARLVRAWLGLRDYSPDATPLVGAVPGVEGAFMIGCVQGGFTIGPLMGRLLAQQILGREPEMPIFDPARLVGPPARTPGLADGSQTAAV